MYFLFIPFMFLAFSLACGVLHWRWRAIFSAVLALAFDGLIITQVDITPLAFQVGMVLGMISLLALILMAGLERHNRARVEKGA